MKNTRGYCHCLGRYPLCENKKLEGRYFPSGTIQGFWQSQLDFPSPHTHYFGIHLTLCGTINGMYHLSVLCNFNLWGGFTFFQIQNRNSEGVPPLPPAIPLCSSRVKQSTQGSINKCLFQRYLNRQFFYVSHLHFIDDILIFCDSSKRMVDRLK
jgi:hypothetical protein